MDDKKISKGNVTMAKRISTGGLLIALAVALSYVEMLLPLAPGIPGIKLGLANLVILGSLYIMSIPEVAVILVARIVLSGLMFSGMSAIIYSLAGGACALAVMSLIKKTGLFSITGVSIAGGVCHNIGQFMAAAVFLNFKSVVGYLPMLLIAGALSGTLVGIVGNKISDALHRKDRKE